MNNTELTIAILTYNTEYNSFQNNRIKNTGKFFKIGKANKKEQIKIYDTFMINKFTPWFNNQNYLLNLKENDFIFQKFNFYSLKKSLNNQEEYKKIVNLLIGFFEKNTKIKDQWKKFIKNYEYQELKIYKENQQNQQLLNQIFNNSKSGYVELAYDFPVIFRYFLLNYVIPSYIVQNAGSKNEINFDKNKFYQLLNDKKSNDIKNFLRNVCEQLNSVIINNEINKSDEIFLNLNNEKISLPKTFNDIVENYIISLLNNNTFWQPYLTENNINIIKNEFINVLIGCIYDKLLEKFNYFDKVIQGKINNCINTKPEMIGLTTDFVNINSEKINLIVNKINNIFEKNSIYERTNDLINLIKNNVTKLFETNISDDVLKPVIIWILLKSKINNLFLKIWLTQLFDEFQTGENSYIIMLIMSLITQIYNKLKITNRESKECTDAGNANNITGRNVILNEYQNINKKLNNEFPDLDLKGSTFLQKFIYEVIQKNNKQNPDIFVVYLQESNMSEGYSDRLIQSLFHELNYDTFTILNSKEIFNMYRSRDSRLASKVKTITKGRIGTGYEKGQRIGIFIKQNITLENLDLSKNKYPSCDDSQGLEFNKSEGNKIIYKRTKKDELNQKILFSCTHDPLQYKSGLVGEHKSKSIISAFFVAKKDNVSYPIFLLNIHLPMEKKSKNYGNSIRNQVFENILKYFELNYSAITFIGGDFNYRLKPLGGLNKNGKPMPNPDLFINKLKVGEYSKLENINRNKNTAFNASNYGSKITQTENIYPFTESSYPNPTCAMKHHQHINSNDNRKLYKTSRQPGFCDRIIYRELNYGEVKANPQLNNEIGHYYYVSNTAYWTPDYHQFWFSDHSPVAGIFKIREINVENYKKEKIFELKNPVYESPIPPQITINDETINTVNYKIKYNITTCHITNKKEFKYFNNEDYMKKLLDKIYKINCNYYPEIIIFNIPNESFRNIFYINISFIDYNKNIYENSIIYYRQNINQESLQQIFDSELSKKIECGFSYEVPIINYEQIQNKQNLYNNSRPYKDLKYKNFIFRLKLSKIRNDILTLFENNEKPYESYIRQLKRDIGVIPLSINNVLINSKINSLINESSKILFKYDLQNITIEQFLEITEILNINPNTLSIFCQQAYSNYFNIILQFYIYNNHEEPFKLIKTIYNQNNNLFSISAYGFFKDMSTMNNSDTPKYHIYINYVFENILKNNTNQANIQSVDNNINWDAEASVYFDIFPA
jgi:hypothetical protein